MTAEENQELKRIVNDYRNGDKKAKKQATEDFYKKCEGFIGYAIKKYFGSYTAYYDDLYQEGVASIMNIIGAYDPDKAELTTYLTRQVVGAMNRYINQMVTYKTSTYYSGIMSKVHMAQKHFEQINKEPTTEDLALYTGLKERDVEDAVRMLVAADGQYYETEEELDNVVQERDTDTAEIAVSNVMSDTVRSAVNKLDEIERDVVIMAYGLGENGRTFNRNEIAATLHIHPEEVTRDLHHSFHVLKLDNNIKKLYDVYSNNEDDADDLNILDTQKDPDYQPLMTEEYESHFEGDLLCVD